MASKFQVGIVKNDGSGFKRSDFSIAALNELRAGQVPEDFGGDTHHNLPEYLGDGQAAQHAATVYDDGGY